MRYARLLLTILGCAVMLSAYSQPFQLQPNTTSEQRIVALTRYCSKIFISDLDSTTNCVFLDKIASYADSIGDDRLHDYAVYYKKCFRILFAFEYRNHFAKDDYKTPIAMLTSTAKWAEKEGRMDIYAACYSKIGAIYFSISKYGSAFEYTLKADEIFRKIEYNKVPLAADYLYYLGNYHYYFNEYDKALGYFKEAAQYQFSYEKLALSNNNTIGLIYLNRNDLENAILIYRKTINEARAKHDSTWISIVQSNLASTFMQAGKYDSAVMYFDSSLNYSGKNPNLQMSDALSSFDLSCCYSHLHKMPEALVALQNGKEVNRRWFTDSITYFKYEARKLGAIVEYNRANGKFDLALAYMDTLNILNQGARRFTDQRIVQRAVEKAETEKHLAEIALLQINKNNILLRSILIIVLLLLILITGLYLFQRFRIKKENEAAIARQKNEQLGAEKAAAELQLQQAEQKLKDYLITIHDKSAKLEDLAEEIEQLKQETNNGPNTETSLSLLAAKYEQLRTSTILTIDDWTVFRTLFEQVYPGFFYNLKQKFADLTPAEIRLLALTKLKMPTRAMADMLGISIDSVHKARYRFRKRMELNEDGDLDALITSI